MKPKLEIPLFQSTVNAGFPSPAEDYVERPLDLNEKLIKRPAATFFVRAAGDSMTGAGILSGDILVVDRAAEPASGKIVIAALQGEFTVKRLKIAKDKITLMPENPNYEPLEISPDIDMEIWGVVTAVVREL